MTSPDGGIATDNGRMLGWHYHLEIGREMQAVKVTIHLEVQYNDRHITLEEVASDLDKQVRGLVALHEPSPCRHADGASWWTASARTDRIAGLMRCTHHGWVPYEHTCRRPGESAMECTGRVLGERQDG